MAGITPRLRPLLVVESEFPANEIAARVQARLDRPDAACIGLVSDRQVDLQIRREERRFWSPQLVVHLKAGETGGTALVGHFGPNGNVWTMFMACYGFVVLSAIVCSFYGMAQLMMDRSPWALWAIPIAAVFVALIYIAAGYGQRLGHDQTETLERFLHQAMGTTEDVAHAV